MENSFLFLLIHVGGFAFMFLGAILISIVIDNCRRDF